jgi:hypothetical protein
MKKFILFLFLSLIVLSGLSSQEISGVVYDAKFDRPLEKVNLIFIGTAHGCVTDRKGYFRISGIRKGKYVLRATLIGYKTYEKEIEIGDAWGWQPHLPAMMGAGFLPLTGSFCRFYRVGWHNLPGFGFGGLVYSAHQAALSVMKNELR